jgi:hypothetical protein
MSTVLIESLEFAVHAPFSEVRKDLEVACLDSLSQIISYIVGHIRACISTISHATRERNVVVGFGC